jgi:murein DD-endopeptidase MepM/ murein hydrolase activator NlpD
MEKKHFSLILVPHCGGKHRSLTLSRKKIRVFTGIGLFFLACLTLVLADYLSMNVTRQKYRDLLSDYENQQKTIEKNEKSIARLENDIAYFENYTRKLNIMAGLKFPDALKEVGVGSGTSSGQAVQITPPPVDPSSSLQKIAEKAEGLEQNLNTLVKFFEDKANILATTPSIWPTRGYLSSAFKWRDDPFTGIWTFHAGLDVATPAGNPVVATADGTVISRTKDKTGGNTIKINHGRGTVTVYCHLSKFEVKVGQKVKRGQVIGLVGSTGKAVGPHVHYEVRLDGKKVNPYYYILEE